MLENNVAKLSVWRNLILFYIPRKNHWNMNLNIFLILNFRLFLSFRMSQSLTMNWDKKWQEKICCSGPTTTTNNSLCRYLLLQWNLGNYFQRLDELQQLMVLYQPQITAPQESQYSYSFLSLQHSFLFCTCAVICFPLFISCLSHSCISLPYSCFPRYSHRIS
mgnify:CR=1 FL=1